MKQEGVGGTAQSRGEPSLPHLTQTGAMRLCPGWVTAMELRAPDSKLFVKKMTELKTISQN